GGWSDYNALFVSYHQRPFGGLAFDLNYTWSRLQDTGGRNQDSGGGFVSDAFDFAYDYGDAVTDRRHVLTAYGNYQLPFAQDLAREGPRVRIPGRRSLDWQDVPDAERHTIEHLRRFLQRVQHGPLRKSQSVDLEPRELRRRHAAGGESADAGFFRIAKRAARSAIRVLNGAGVAQAFRPAAGARQP